MLKVLIHPNFDPITAKHDIALLKLTTEVQFTTHIQPTCLPIVSLKDTQTEGFAVGFGRTETGHLADILRQAKMEVISTFECLDSNRDFYGLFLYRGNFCAGYRNLKNSSKPTPCAGDSGGGMYVEENGRWILQGLVSIGLKSDEGGCDVKNFVLFTDIFEHKNWIIQNMK